MKDVDQFVMHAAPAEENYRLRVLWMLMPLSGVVCVLANWAFSTGANDAR